MYVLVGIRDDGVVSGGVRGGVVMMFEEIAVDQHVFEVAVSGMGEKGWVGEEVRKCGICVKGITNGRWIPLLISGALGWSSWCCV